MAESVRVIDGFIGERIGEEGSVFVFPSEMAASAYADRVLEGGGRATLPMERFIAWDSFLEEAVLPQQRDRSAISDVMRKMFAAIVLDENARRAKSKQPPLFQSIIHPVYAQYSSSFASWIAAILPQLGLWAECVLGTAIERIEEGSDTAQSAAQNAGLDDEARDYRALILHYKQFLNDNNLFENAWEKPPFTHNGKRYYLFFTEALADFPLYRKLLSAAAPHVTIVQTPVQTPALEEERFKPYFLKNAKSEITAAALYIMNIRQKGAEYCAITVTSPDLEAYEPYILDEFAAHGIPVQNGSGKPLSSYPAGRLFAALSECMSQKMAVDAVSSLLLNRSIPWKEEAKIGALVAYGINNNCVCSWEAEDGGLVDVWEHAFEKKPSALRGFYRDLKNTVLGLCSVDRFAKIRDRYFAFREKFIDTAKFQSEPVYFEANTVLGRCIAELSVLIQIEKKYPQVTVPAPWQFYIDHLNSTIYKTQSTADGVNLLPYRVSASVPSLCHIILGTNQNAMPQVFRELSFLSGIKKRSLHIEDIDASEVFFQLHQFSSAQQAAFFCAEETFTGFALPYNSLGPLDAPLPLAALLSAEGTAHDFHPSYYQAEMRFLDAVFDNAAEPADIGDPPRFFALQKDGFDAFAKRHPDARHPDAPATRLFSGGAGGIKARIAARYMKDGRLVVSASALLPYYQCALFWLFGNVYQIEDIDAETTLMSPFARGNIYHDVMKRVFTRIKEQRLPLGLTETGAVPPEFQTILAESADAAFAALPESRESALTTELLLPQREAVGEKCRLLLEKMLKKFASCTVAEVEPEPEWEMAAPDFTLAGIPDLLLYDGEADNYIIVDFKSGKPPSKSDCTAAEGEGLKHFQLPIYHKLAESKGFTPTEAGFFTGIKEATIDQRFYPPTDDEKKPSFAAIEEDFAAKTRRYVNEVLSVDFEKSCNKKYGECLRCDYRRVCRTTFSVQRETRMGRKTG